MLTSALLIVGYELQLWRAGETIADRTLPGRQFVKLPDEQIGLAFVFRAFPTISYALIMRGTQPVEVGDRASNPSDDTEIPRVRTEAETEADRVLRQPLRPSSAVLARTRVSLRSAAHLKAIAPRGTRALTPSCARSSSPST